MNISIIIPVYNAGNFVEQAVQSAITQPETAEVILVEDGSKDNSFEVCKALADKYDKVCLLRHPDGENRGAGASRNLGMRRAQYDYISFLDADDYYLPGRFTVAKEIFRDDPECDGVYEAMGINFESKYAKEQWLSSPMANIGMTTMSEVVLPEDLFEKLLLGGAGYFSICGLVIKKSIIKKVGVMNEKLRLHQDSDFIFRISAVGNLLPGKLDEPVVMRRVHTENRISKPRSKTRIYKDRIKMWKATYQWAHKNSLPDKEQLVFDTILSYCVKSKSLPFEWMKKLPKEFTQLIKLFLLPWDYPQVLIKLDFWKKLLSVPIWNVFLRLFQNLLLS
ncbi:MAG: glycosyltransferase family 2 protein [Candidatus Helarchaeota archaeon]